MDVFPAVDVDDSVIEIIVVFVADKWLDKLVDDCVAVLDLGGALDGCSELETDVNEVVDDEVDEVYVSGRCYQVRRLVNYYQSGFLTLLFI